jgi:hypothetical protein
MALETSPVLVVDEILLKNVWIPQAGYIARDQIPCLAQKGVYPKIAIFVQENDEKLLDLRCTGSVYPIL